MSDRLYTSLSRVTSSGAFIAEVDGPPPYILMMLGSFVLLLIVKGGDAAGLWPRLAVGLAYLHGATYAELNLLLHTALFAPILLAFSAAFFLLIEKPCMRPDWPSRLSRRFRKALARDASKELAAGSGYAG